MLSVYTVLPFLVLFIDGASRELTVKIRSVTANNCKNEFVLVTDAGVEYAFPYAQAMPAPTPDDPLAELFVNEKLGREAVNYRLHSGHEGSVHLEQVLEYNEVPEYLADLLLYRLTLEAPGASRPATSAGARWRAG